MTAGSAGRFGEVAAPGQGAPGRRPGRLLALTSEHDREAAGEARRLVAEAMGAEGAPADLVADARTVVTELVVDALVRGWAPAHVVVTTGPVHVRLDVVARGRRPAPQVEVDRRAAMDLVQRLSVGHGSQPSGDGRRWWAVLERRPAGG